MFTKLIVVASGLFLLLQILKRLRRRNVGIATHVVDGDGFTLLRDHGLSDVRIRIAWIDAPEADQPYGHEAGAALRRLIANKTVRIRVVDKDRWGRAVAWVTCEGKDVGLQLIKTGMAWSYPGISPGQGRLRRMRYAWAQYQARIRHIGLWTQRKPVPPWEHKHRPTWKKVIWKFW